MIFVPIEQLRVGMLIARSIDAGGASAIPLLVQGQILTDRLIKKLQEKNITGAYVDTEFSKDIEPGEIISPAVKQKALRGIKKVFEDVTKYSKISIENTRLITEIARELVLKILENDEVLIDFLDLKDYDDYTYRHSLSVAIFGITIGRKLGFGVDILIEIATSALLHDIGKIEISIDIVNKPGKLTAEEYAIMKTHPELAVKHLRKQTKLSESVLKGILTHHERYNGTGYPEGLAGDNIPVYGRILAVSDVYDALTSLRPYRKAWFPNEAIEYLLGCNGIHFDPDILDAFLKVVVPYPVGTLVELSNGCPAVVLKNNDNRLRPIVRMFNTADDVSFCDIDLMHDISYINVTIVSLGYKNSKVDYQAFVQKPEEFRQETDVDDSDAS